MHSVSPVHVRAESSVKNPMRTTNFEVIQCKKKKKELLNKVKKRVKISASSNFKSDEPNQTRKQRAYVNPSSKLGRNNKARVHSASLQTFTSKFKSKSLSPVKSKTIHWCPPPGRTKKAPVKNKSESKDDLTRTLRLCEIDHIPVRDTPSVLRSAPIGRRQTLETTPIHRSSCDLRTNARSRSHSHSPYDCYQDRCEQFFASPFRSPSRSSCNSSSSRSVPPIKPTSYNNLRRNRASITINKNSSLAELAVNRRFSLSPSSSSFNRSIIDPNTTYTKRTKSHDSSLRCSPAPQAPFNPLNGRDLLVEKLVETEAYANEIGKHLGLVKDFLACDLTNPCNFLQNAPCILQRFEFDRIELLKRLELFEMSNRELKAVIYDLVDAKVAMGLRVAENNAYLCRNIEALEHENSQLKQSLSQIERNMQQTGSAYQVLNMENNMLSNLKTSLEDNRAHLRRLLLAKESEVNRLHVQIKNLDRKLDRAQIEIEILRESRERAGLSTLKFPESKPTAKVTSIANKNPITSSSVLAASSRINNDNLRRRNIKLCRQVYTLEEILNDPLKVRLYIDKLNVQIKEKETVIKNLNETIVAVQGKPAQQAANLSIIKEDISEKSEQLNSQHKKDRNEIENLIRENEKLKSEMHLKDDRIKKIEIKLKAMTTENASKKPPPNDPNQQSLEMIRKKLSYDNTLNSNSSGEDFSGINLMSSHSLTNINQFSTYSNNPEPKSKPSGKSLTKTSKTQDLLLSEKNTQSSENKVATAVAAAELIAMTSRSDDGLDTTIHRMKNFSEIELDQVRSRLQQRLNELETLPELLRNTEIKLQESVLKLKQYEVQNSEYKNLVTKLKFQLDLAEKETALMKRERKIKESGSQDGARLAESAIKRVENNAKQKAAIEHLNKLEPIGNKLRHYEDEMKEMIRLLGLKEDMIRDLTSKLSSKANEGASLGRQLELALSDSSLKEKQLRERSLNKERVLQLKCSELEAKLASMQFHSSVHNRDKDEIAQDYVSQLKDMKAKYEQAQLTNKQMQEYVNFLKNSYITYFNDSTFQNFENLGSKNFY